MRFDDNQSIDASAMTNTDILVGTDVSTGTDKKFTLANLASWIMTRFSIPTAANLAAAAGTLLGMVRANNLTGGANRNGWTALTSGQDLNSLTTPGVYYATSAIMASVVNAPYTGQCKVIVENTYANANNVQQTVIPGNSTTVVYTRRGTAVLGSSASWSDWSGPTTGTVTLASGITGTVHTATRVHRKGNVVVADLRFQPITVGTSTTTIATLASSNDKIGILPHSVVYGACIGSGGIPGAINVTSAGLIQVVMSQAISAGYIMACLVWTRDS